MVEMFLIVLENQVLVIRIAPQVVELVGGGLQIVELADGVVVVDDAL